MSNFKDNRSFENAVNYLLYVSMKLTRKDLDLSNRETYLETIMDKAYNDATMQGAFNALAYKGTSGSNSQLKEEKEELKKQLIGKDANGKKVSVDGGCCKERLQKCIVKFIDDLSEVIDCTEEEYNNRHKELCNEICNEFGKYTDLFSFGNAQKWVNMTMKYLYVVESLCEEAPRFATPLAKVLHIPIDSYIIEKIWDLEDGLEDSCLPGVGKHTGEYKSEKVKSWSKWDEDDYKKFIDNVKSLMDEEIRLHWESLAWIEIAEARKSK